MYLYGSPNDQVRMAILQSMYLRGIWSPEALTCLANEYASERKVIDDYGGIVHFADKVIYHYIFNKGHSGRGTNFTGRKLLVLSKVLGIDDPLKLDEKFHMEFEGSLPCRWVGDCGSVLAINPIKYKTEMSIL